MQAESLFLHPPIDPPNSKTCCWSRSSKWMTLPPSRKAVVCKFQDTIGHRKGICNCPLSQQNSLSSCIFKCAILNVCESRIAGVMVGFDANVVLLDQAVLNRQLTAVLHQGFIKLGDF